MPYAANGQLSKSPLEGGIEITDEQYREAIEAAQQGKRVAVQGGALQLLSSDKRKVYNTADGSLLEIYADDETPVGYAETERPSEFHEWVSGEWIQDEQAALEAWRETASVTSRQGEQQLIIAGLDEQVEAAIDAIADPLQRKLTSAWYRRASTWERMNPEFVAMGAALGLTDEQMDEHIREAMKL
ncbi:hypothetical protein R3F64_01165 [Halomonas sp. 5021]|uniref:hypothetical protein n=1 Tax=Halomonas sp. 5021 TaxID=3082156 RepID=UPI002FCA15D8